ncbi:MAG: 2TM domain-containing protein [Leptolyngbyaceae cyanobacterium RU_5_1]|nr:2TM domain-containing protein [Leptolyngbyaceae cyanobacterium RU_5_1]
MPPRWPRQPDRSDPAYRRLDDRMTFATHVALFAAINSGLWFFRVLAEKSAELSTPGGVPGTPWVTGIWALILIAHAVFVFASANYSDAISSTSQAGTGFGSTTKQKSLSKSSKS